MTTIARKRTDRSDFDAQPRDIAKLFDKLPPHSLEAEMSLLGSMILAGTENLHIIGEIVQIIKNADDFYLPKHAAVYQCLVDLYDHRSSVDATQLTQMLRDRSLLENIGGVDYLIELAESVPTAVNAPHYAQIVRDKAKLRHLINAAGTILREAHESAEPANIVLDKAEKQIFEIAQTSSENDPASLRDLMAETFEALERRQESGRTITGLASGFFQLDEMMSGLQRGEMIIIAARPSMGKTAFALNIAEYIAVDSKQPVAVFSLEMGKQQLAERLLSARSGVDSQRMRRNMLNGEELARLQETAAELAEAPMYIDDTPGISAMELRAKARRLASQHDLQCIIIDYLQLMSFPGSESRQAEVSAISRSVKALARELRVPVICLSQLNRNPEGRESKRPMLSDLRESGSIEQDADVCMMLHREAYYHNGDAEWAAEHAGRENVSEIIIAKQRNGPTGVVEVLFDGKTTRFLNLARGYGE